MTITPQVRNQARAIITERFDDLEVQALLLRAASQDTIFSAEKLRVWKLGLRAEFLNLCGWIDQLEVR